jgi:hypothetical protein
MYAGAGATGSDAESEATEDAAREGTELGASTTGATEPGTGRRATALAAGRQPAAGTEARVGAGRSAAGRTAETAEELGEGARRPAERELVDRATTPKGLWEGTTDLEAEFLTPWLEMGASLFSSAIRSRTIAATGSVALGKQSGSLGITDVGVLVCGRLAFALPFLCCLVTGTTSAA